MTSDRCFERPIEQLIMEIATNSGKVFKKNIGHPKSIFRCQYDSRFELLWTSFIRSLMIARIGIFSQKTSQHLLFQ